MSKALELRRHTDNDGDLLSDEGIADALRIGAELRGPYDLVVSTGAQRATQTAACFLAALGQQVPGGLVVEPGLRSVVEERWRAAYEQAGSAQGGPGGYKSSGPLPMIARIAAPMASLRRSVKRFRRR